MGEGAAGHVRGCPTVTAYGSDLSRISTLDDVVAYVIALFGAIIPADPTDIKIGDLYNMNEGAPPRVRIVIGEGGALGPVLEVSAGQVAGITERATCYIWGDPAAADTDENRAAKALGVRLINCFKMAAVGRLKGAQLTRANKTKAAKYGEEYVLLLDYSWGVPRDKVVDAAARALGAMSASPPDPDRPNGDTGSTFHVTVTNANTRP